MTRWTWLSVVVLASLASGAPATEAEAPSAEKGRQLLTSKHYTPPIMTLAAYEDIWRVWGLEKKPSRDELHRLFAERYGLQPAPYPNNGFPMGVREAMGLLG